MFQREEHRVVLRVLRALDEDLLKRLLALFGGGTRLVLELGEYRISQDIDFLSSEPRAFAELRSLARQGGHGGLLYPRPPRPSQSSAASGVLARTEPFDSLRSLRA